MKSRRFPSPQVGLQAAEAGLGALSALLSGDRRTAAELRQLGGLQTLVGIVGKVLSAIDLGSAINPGE